MVKHSWGVLALAYAGVVWGAGPESVVPFKADVRVGVGEDGAPREVVVNQQLPEPIRRAMEARIAQWRFEPLVVDGRPSVGTTYVFVDACVVQREDGQLGVAMDYLWNGPGYADNALRHPPPLYPPDAARAGSVGSFRVIKRIGVDGAVTIESIERLSGPRKSFESALRAWATALRYVPEEVNGVPVETRIVIPVDFKLSGPPSRKDRAKQRVAAQGSDACITASGGGEQDNPVVSESLFRLQGPEE